LQDGYQILFCSGCDLGFASPVPDQSAFDRYYKELSKYSSVSVTSGSGVQPWDRDRLDAMARRLAAFARARGGASIADIGCGSGGSLPHYASAGFTTVFGVDPSAACVRAASALMETHGVSGGAVQGTFGSLPGEIEHADAYVLSHVLEHVRDVSHALRSLWAIAHESSLLYVEVPDASRFADFPASPLLEFNTEHINYFSVHSLCEAITAAGWGVVASGRDIIPNGPCTQYPTAWVVAERETSRARTVESGFFRSELVRYIQQDASRIQRIETCLRRDPIVGPVAVWGTGQTTAILLANSSLGTTDIRAFVDSDPRFVGRKIHGAPVVPVEFIRDHPDWTIFISSVLAESSIRTTIRQNSLTNRIVSLAELLA
jgi:SAM-dependent methyltransferase